MRNLSELIGFYRLFKMLDSVDKDTLIATREAGDEQDIVDLIDVWSTTHSSSNIKIQCLAVLEARQAE